MDETLRKSSAFGNLDASARELVAAMLEPVPLVRSCCRPLHSGITSTSMPSLLCLVLQDTLGKQ